MFRGLKPIDYIAKQLNKLKHLQKLLSPHFLKQGSEKVKFRAPFVVLRNIETYRLYSNPTKKIATTVKMKFVQTTDRSKAVVLV